MTASDSQAANGDAATGASGSALAAEVAHMRTELAQAKAELQEFVYTVSHDLRAPLRHIFAYAQVIEEDWPDAPLEMRSHLATIRSSAQLLTQQLDGLTQLSRIANQSIQLQAVDLAALVRDLADELMQNKPECKVQWRLAGDVPHVVADASGLSQVLPQLLDNALKFSRDRDQATIELTWRRLPTTVAHQSERIEISLKDNGIGFAPEQANKLFKVFGKLHPAREFEGQGLGLVLARKWLERMHGTIELEGVSGAGCCATITLPAAPH
jgi:light-regulated signal transduction histidine kinase (bacteriophytochrome)